MISHNDNLSLHHDEEAAASWCMRIAEQRLDLADQAEFEQWISANAHNARLFEQMVAVWQYTDAIAELPGFLALRAKALNAMEQAQASSEAAKSPSRRRALAAAAGFALFAVMGAWNWSTGPDVYATSIGERRNIQLADGSRVSLDAASQISVSFKDERRSIMLDHGRAKFDVAKDPMRPFTVTAGSQAVVAIGTSFSVELLKDQLRVLLFEGEVAVVPQKTVVKSLPSVKNSASAASLHPGQELVATLTTGAGKIIESDSDRALSWEEGRIDFIDIPLSEAVERINRYSALPIMIEDAAAGRKIINGVFDAGDTESFLSGVTSLYKLKSRVTEKSILITSIKNKEIK